MFPASLGVRRGKRTRFTIIVGTSAALIATGSVAAVALTDHTLVGPRTDGSAYTSSGQQVRPAGAQTSLGDLPLGSALSPDGKTTLVSNDGQATQSLQVVDVATGQVAQSIDYKSPNGLFVGLAFSPDGTKAYAAGGGTNTVHTYGVSGQHLTEGTPIALPTKNPAGAAIKPYPAGLGITPDGSRLVVADHLADAVSVVTLATGATATLPVGHAPVGVAVSRDGSKAWVTNQGASSVSVVSLAGSPAVSGTVNVGVHPNAVRLSRDGSQLFVADGDSDQLSVLDAASSQVARTISLAPYAGARAGSSPFGIAQSTDGTSLYVTTAGNNAVDVVDLGKGAVSARIPTAWYPTGIEATASRLLVLNAKGLGAGPNNGPGHPDPTSSQPTAANQYAGSMMVGTLSSIDLPLNEGRLTAYTNQVAHNDGFDKPMTGQGVPAIKHVIYVLQENRTFDQVFGSLGKGNGDPSLNLFGDESAPNQRALERNFVTLDNFYADAEISARGWNWGVAANSNAYTETMWPSNYSGRGAPYPSENDDKAIVPNKSLSDAYIWQRLAASNVSFRNYGFYVRADHADPTRMVGTDPVLDANTDHSFRGFDMACPDNPDTFKPLSATCGTPRFTAWKQEFDGYVANGNLPTVELLRLPSDHTAGTKSGSPTPRAYVADNDLALGRVVDAVSHSPYWKDTAIVVTEDDAQNGPDHVDAHRTIAQVISPYTQSGAVDSTLYSTSSMLRTIENIVGIAPMTQFDTFATPLVGLFGRKPDDTPFSVIRPDQAGNILNGASAPLAAASARQDLTKEDQIDVDTFNRAIWQSVKGAGSPMPAPVNQR